MNINNIEVTKLISIILKNDFKAVSLQFSDEYLPFCVQLHESMRNELKSSNNTQVQLYITADSTFGSSIDDVSAAHVNCDLIIYIGTDLSSSGTIPTVVTTFNLRINVCICATSIASQLKLSNFGNKIILLSDLGFHYALQQIQLQLMLMGIESTVGLLPLNANLDDWGVDISCENSLFSIGGLLVPNSCFISEVTIVYVGTKKENIQNIAFSRGNYALVCLDPTILSPSQESYATRAYLPNTNDRELRLRYGAISKVKDYKVIGLLVGSMGLSASKLQDIISRLQSLIIAAGKRYYVLVMGRLTESKLCNFPEIEMFCLISNDDTSYIPPK